MHIAGRIPVIPQNIYVCIPLCTSAHLSTIVLTDFINPLKTKPVCPCPKVTGISPSLQLSIAHAVNDVQVTFHQFCKKRFLTCFCGIFEKAQRLQVR